MDANALCFGADFPATGLPCHVEIVPSGITLRFDGQPLRPDGDVVPFSNLSVSAGGLDHDQLVVRWSEEQGRRTLYLKDHALIRAFRETAPNIVTGELEAAASMVRQNRRTRRISWVAAIALVLSLGSVLWFGSDLAVNVAVDRIPVEWERQLGEAAYRDFLARHTVVKEGPAVDAVQEMTRRLTDQIPDDPYRFEVTVVRSDVVNAFALPGGYVVVFTGLLQKAETGEEVAGVLSHELSHVLQRHGLERIVKQVGLMTVLSIVLGDQQGLIGLTKQIGGELLTLKFGRAQETEADVAGLRLLNRARIDSNGLVRFFERMAEQEHEPIAILSTHPISAARVERLKEEAKALPKLSGESFTFDWKHVQGSLQSPR
ncbi:MAG: M48 family metallopeptidase [Nitrospira sp.]|nr:M48 family metallopeptidase [Nitrospira sp.]